MEDVKTILVTGANSGIGYEVAKQFCREGHDVIISVRDDAKGKATVSTIKAEVPDAKLVYLIMEMSDPQSIRNFTKEFLSIRESLHILINNAGMMMNFSDIQRHKARGDPELEITVTVNSIGPFLLTNLLLDVLKASSSCVCPSRIINITSRATVFYYFKHTPKFDIENTMFTKPGSYRNGFQAYRWSKIILNLWSNELSKKLIGTHVTVNTICPGIIPNTALNRDLPYMWWIVWWIMQSFIGRIFLNTTSPPEGAKRVVDLASNEKYSHKTGLFYMDDKPHEETPAVLDAENQSKVWSICARYAGLETD